MFDMNYNFIKDNLRYLVNGLRVDKSALELFIEGRDNSFILNHNIDAISSVLSFLNSSDNIFILNGFMGSGKTYVADFLLDFISSEVLVFKNSYQEAINSDDILLSLFKDFSVYHNEKKILLPKTETNVFSEKINSYIKHCPNPMLFVFDSFEINMRSKDTQKDILDFINYLSHFEKVKIIICSRTFRIEDLISQIGAVDYTLKSLTKEEVFSFLSMNNITGSTFELEDLYKVVRGHFLLLELSVLIMQIMGLPLNLFSNEYKKSAKNFLDFLISKILNTTSDKFIKLLLFLTSIRHGVTSDFLIGQEIAVIEDIAFLCQKHVISEKFGKYYLKDYLKAEFIKNISLRSRIKVHKYIIELYEEELPLKPFERNLFLSRQTMRQEIAYHKAKIDALEDDLEKSGKSKLAESQDFNYLSYSRTSGYDEKASKRQVRQRKYISELKKQDGGRRRIEVSDENSLILNSIKEEDVLEKNLMSITKIQNDDFDLAVNKEVSESVEDVPAAIDDYIKIAKEYESAFNFSGAVLYYKKALSYTSDVNFEEKEPVIYMSLALCYRKIQDIESSVNAYEKAYSIYSRNDRDKANEVLLNIARMYSEQYKFDKAKEYYKQILYSPLGVSSQMVIRIYLDLSEIEDNNMDSEAAVKYVKKALQEAEKENDIKILSECYFKYALLADDAGDTEISMKYYLRCIQVSNNPEINTFMSSAYANLAEISADNNNLSAAKMYYELSIDADKKQNNIEGLYYSYSKLAELYKDENPEKTYELLLKALSAAKRFDDVNYSVAIYIEIGDYYMNLNNFKQALKSYIIAKRLVGARSSDDMLAKISSRIEKIKNILGDVGYMRIVDEIKNKK